MNELIKLTAKDQFQLDAYLAKPQGKPLGAIVLLQEIFGLNSHIKATADRYAAEGYLVIAPATQARAEENLSLGYTQEDMAKGFAHKNFVESLPNEVSMQDIQAAIDYVAHAGKVGVVGYCWGGLLSWRSACKLQGLSAAVSYYPGGIAKEKDLTATCPVLMHFANQDSHIPLSDVELFKEAQKNVKDVEVFVYEGQHGFNCDQRAAYNQAAADLARERTLAFYKQHLQSH
jgi:carboxymethylenebutenolidase